jgi:hypothetical protein
LMATYGLHITMAIVPRFLPYNGPSFEKNHEQITSKIWDAIFDCLSHADKRRFAKVCKKWQIVACKYVDLRLQMASAQKYFVDVWTDPLFKHFKDLTDICSDQHLYSAGNYVVVYRPQRNTIIVFKGSRKVEELRPSDLFVDQTPISEDLVKRPVYQKFISALRSLFCGSGHEFVERPLTAIRVGDDNDTILVYTQDRVAKITDKDGDESNWRSDKVDVMSLKENATFTNTTCSKLGNAVAYHFDGITYVKRLDQQPTCMNDMVPKRLYLNNFVKEPIKFLSFISQKELFMVTCETGSYSVYDLNLDLLQMPVVDNRLQTATGINVGIKIIAIGCDVVPQNQHLKHPEFTDTLVIPVCKNEKKKTFKRMEPITFRSFNFDCTQFGSCGDTVVFVDQIEDWTDSPVSSNIKTDLVVFDTTTGHVDRITLAVEAKDSKEFAAGLPGGSSLKVLRDTIVLVGYRDHLYAVQVCHFDEPTLLQKLHCPDVNFNLPKRLQKLHCPDINFSSMEVRPNGTDITYLHRKTGKLEVLSLTTDCGDFKNGSIFKFIKDFYSWIVPC